MLKRGNLTSEALLIFIIRHNIVMSSQSHSVVTVRCEGTISPEPRDPDSTFPSLFPTLDDISINLLGPSTVYWVGSRACAGIISLSLSARSLDHVVPATVRYSHSPADSLPQASCLAALCAEIDNELLPCWDRRRNQYYLGTTAARLSEWSPSSGNHPYGGIPTLR